MKRIILLASKDCLNIQWLSENKKKSKKIGDQKQKRKIIFNIKKKKKKY